MENKPFIDFQGKKVVVTGASSGIGRAICIELSKFGASLVLIGRDNDRLNETAALLGASQYYIMQMDLNDLASISPKIREFAQDHGKIYGFCHCAGVDDTRPLSSYKIEILRSMLDINLVAGIELCRVLCRRDVMEDTGGSILFVSSIAANVGIPGRVGYSATKGGLISAARSMAVELAKRKIRVNTISPGLIHTSMTDGALSKLTSDQIRDIEESHPLGIGTPQDVARGAVFLMAPQSGWITGMDLIIDGGYTAK